MDIFWNASTDSLKSIKLKKKAIKILTYSNILTEEATGSYEYKLAKVR